MLKKRYCVCISSDYNLLHAFNGPTTIPRLSTIITLVPMRGILWSHLRKR